MFSYDEEIGCLGAPRMIAAASGRIGKPAAVIVGEPYQHARGRRAQEHLHHFSPGSPASTLIRASGAPSARAR